VDLRPCLDVFEEEEKILTPAGNLTPNIPSLVYVELPLVFHKHQHVCLHVTLVVVIFVVVVFVVIFVKKPATENLQ
jgi:hypothetical protein